MRVDQYELHKRVEPAANNDMRKVLIPSQKIEIKLWPPSVGESSEVDHQMILAFSVLNNSRQAFELLPPQIVLKGRSANDKGQEIKAEPIAITDCMVTKKPLERGERADGWLNKPQNTGFRVRGANVVTC